MEEAMSSALDLIRRLPPDEQENAIESLIVLCPQLDCSKFRSQTEKPLSLAFDPKSKRHFVVSEYNRHRRSHRSPWSNTYVPEVTSENAFYPSPHLRELEIRYNTIFDAYRNAYHKGGVSSVYLWALPAEDGFAAAFLIKCEQDGHGFFEQAGWSTAHVVMVTQSTSHVVYRVVSTAWLQLGREVGSDERLKLGGQLFRSAEQSHKLSEQTGEDSSSHLPIIGGMIEEIDSTFRKSLERVQFNKIREIVDGTRSFEQEVDENTEASAEQPGTHPRVGLGESPIAPSPEFLTDLKEALRRRV